MILPGSERLNWYIAHVCDFITPHQQYLIFGQKLFGGGHQMYLINGTAKTETLALHY